VVNYCGLQFLLVKNNVFSCCLAGECAANMLINIKLTVFHLDYTAGGYIICRNQNKVRPLNPDQVFHIADWVNFTLCSVSWLAEQLYQILHSKSWMCSTAAHSSDVIRAFAHSCHVTSRCSVYIWPVSI